jgi:hypothetical protein
MPVEFDTFSRTGLTMVQWLCGHLPVGLLKRSAALAQYTAT